MKLLLVEDSEEDAILLVKALKKGLGADVVVDRVSTVSAALQKAAAGKYGAAIVDLCVDDSLGLTTLSRFLAGAPNLPVIVISGYGDELIRREALAAGAKAFLVKGTGVPADLTETVRACVG